MKTSSGGFQLFCAILGAILGIALLVGGIGAIVFSEELSPTMSMPAELITLFGVLLIGWGVFILYMAYVNRNTWAHLKAKKPLPATVSVGQTVFGVIGGIVMTISGFVCFSAAQYKLSEFYYSLTLEETWTMLKYMGICLIVAGVVQIFTAFLSYAVQMNKNRSNAQNAQQAANTAEEHQETGAPAAINDGASNFCSKCGNPLIPDENFCSKCGNKISK